MHGPRAPPLRRVAGQDPQPAGAAGSQITAGHRAPHRPRIDPDALGDLRRGEDRSGLAMIVGATTIPIGMLFVPSAGGISYHPNESTTAADIDRGVAVLAAALARISGG